MRKVVFGGACSLDGYFAREDGGVDWLQWSDDVQKIMAEMWPRFDVMVMGRKTWEHSMAQFSEEDIEKARAANSGMKEYVFSRSLPAGLHKNGYEIVNEEAGEFVKRLKNQGAPAENHPVGEAPTPLLRKEGSSEPRDIMVMGGGELGCALLDAGVVDEIGFNIQPVVLGSGIPLWHRMSRQVDLELIECRALKHGCVYVMYKVLNKEGASELG